MAPARTSALTTAATGGSRSQGRSAEMSATRPPTKARRPQALTLTHLLLFALLVIGCCLIAPAEARSHDKEGRRRGDRVSAATSSSATGATMATSNYYETAGNVATGPLSASALVTHVHPVFGGRMDTTGFCTRHRDMKLMCYCTPDENHVPVQKAECWVFSEGLYQNDTTWTRFYQQKRLRDLKFVIQNHGRLDYIPTMILEPLKNLTSVTIEYAQVEVVRSHAFGNLPHLERIILTNNQILALDQDAFANHVRLRELNLENNQIYDIDRFAFRNLPQCERLLLNNNNISNLHEGLFAEMARLVYLNLAHNQISVLTSEIFKGLGNLNVFKLTRNNLNFIGDTVFTELWSLVELELDDNRIERISERALDGLNNLKTLNLRNNLLKKIDNGLLRGTPALLSINVQSNELETLTYYTFQPIMDNLVNNTSELLLSDNNFICDCRLLWIFDLRNRTRHLQLRDSLEEFVCSLQEPQLVNFVDPVPNHILDLLNIGGYTSSGVSVAGVGGGNAGGTGRKRMSKSRQLQARNQMHRQEATTMELIGGRGPDSLSSQRATKRRRSIADGGGGGLLKAAVVDGNAPATVPDVLARQDNPSHNQEAPLHANYYDDLHGGGVGAPMTIAQQVADVEDDLDLMKQNALFSHQHEHPLVDTFSNNLVEGGSNVVAGSGIGGGGGGGGGVAASGTMPLSKPARMGIKVRLFTLRPANLPCHDELADPTELPLSRDLVDVRSNMPGSGMSAAGAGTMLQRPLLLMAFAILLVAGGGRAG